MVGRLQHVHAGESPQVRPSIWNNQGSNRMAMERIIMAMERISPILEDFNPVHDIELLHVGTAEMLTVSGSFPRITSEASASSPFHLERQPLPVVQAVHDNVLYHFNCTWRSPRLQVLSTGAWEWSLSSCPLG